jgi:YegS/Rv2252/BmrU family lipid kinase
MPAVRPLRAFDAVDRRLLGRLTRHPRPRLESALTRLSRSANRSLLWLVMAEVLAAVGGRPGRRAALRGVVAIALTAPIVNGPLKALARRNRPDPRHDTRSPSVRIPTSFSFPSGHAAAAFAFATGAALEDARLYPLLYPMAAAVAYSRVVLRVHYPFDVLAGALIGLGAGLVSGPLTKAVRDELEAYRPAPPAERPASRQVILVFSPNAGRATKRLGRGLQAMAAYGLEVIERLRVDEVDRLPDLLRTHADAQPLVVAAGGDGTVGAVANCLVGTPLVLGVLPLGTSNDFARSLHIPMHVARAARLLALGRVSAIDAGRLSRPGNPPQYFVHAATAGLNVRFARLATRADLRRRLGPLTYAVAGVLALRERAVFDAAIGTGERLRLMHLSVINAPVFGGLLDLEVPGADPDDRTLSVLLIEDLPMRRLVRSVVELALGLRRPIRGVRLHHVASFPVHATTPVEVALDGEVRGHIPGTFDVVPDGLRVVTPASFTGSR